MSTNCRTHHCAILARKLVKADRVSLAVVVRTTWLVGMVEDIEVVVINVVASKDIGDEFQDRGFSKTSLSNKKRIVYGSFVLRFDIFTTPFLRDGTSLEMTIRTIVPQMPCVPLDRLGVILVIIFNGVLG